MNSHEYANKLKELAELLLSRPEFETPWNTPDYAYIAFYYWSEKDKFLGAVRALGAGKKEWKKDELDFDPTATDMLKLRIERSAVCVKVQEEKWECEPLLSEAEEAEIGQSA